FPYTLLRFESLKELQSGIMVPCALFSCLQIIRVLESKLRSFSSTNRIVYNGVYEERKSSLSYISLFVPSSV
ncbi:hypothetical protein CRM22_000958, partial [Opisthorchis felineus]